MKRSLRALQSGFTLIEVLVSISLMMILVGVVVFVFTQATAAFNRSVGISEIYQNARVSVDLMERHIRSAFPIDHPKQHFWLFNTYANAEGFSSEGDEGGGSSDDLLFHQADAIMFYGSISQFDQVKSAYVLFHLAGFDSDSQTYRLYMTTIPESAIGADGSVDFDNAEIKRDELCQYVKSMRIKYSYSDDSSDTDKRIAHYVNIVGDDDDGSADEREDNESLPANICADNDARRIKVYDGEDDEYQFLVDISSDLKISAPFENIPFDTANLFAKVINKSLDGVSVIRYPGMTLRPGVTNGSANQKVYLLRFKVFDPGAGDPLWVNPDPDSPYYYRTSRILGSSAENSFLVKPLPKSIKVTLRVIDEKRLETRIIDKVIFIPLN